MFYNHKKEGLEIKLSWKERFMFLFTGVIKFNRKSSSQHFTHLLYLISKGIKQYGDMREHGKSFEKEESH